MTGELIEFVFVFKLDCCSVNGLSHGMACLMRADLHMMRSIQRNIRKLEVEKA